MPELPEVETIARELSKVVLGKRVTAVRLSGLPLRKPIPRQLPILLRGRTIHRVRRRGKYIIIRMEPRLFWLLHLGMSGSLLFHSKKIRRSSHTHAVFRFSDDSELHFCDPRRFGLLLTYEENRIPEIEKLGPDPLSAAFNAKSLHPRLSSSRLELKAFLLDQNRIAGIGNIYACEALFHARLHPERCCDSLDAHETSRLVRSVRKVLKSAIRHGGTSISDFRDVEGQSGSHQMHLYVYQREGQVCRKCGENVSRLRQGNRSTFLCPNCQPAL